MSEQSKKDLVPVLAKGLQTPVIVGERLYVGESSSSDTFNKSSVEKKSSSIMQASVCVQTDQLNEQVISN